MKCPTNVLKNVLPFCNNVTFFISIFKFHKILNSFFKHKNCHKSDFNLKRIANGNK